MEDRLFHAFTLEGYSDAELGRLVRQALAGTKTQSVPDVRARRAFAAASRLVGYGWLDDALELAVIAWETTKDLWRRIFRR
jgi:hypothetical protein